MRRRQMSDIIRHTDDRERVQILRYGFDGFRKIPEGVRKIVLESYRAARPSAAIQPSAAMACCLGGWLAWLHYNVRRSLGDTGASTDERALGAREAATTLDTLRRLAAGIETWASWT